MFTKRRLLKRWPRRMSPCRPQDRYILEQHVHVVLNYRLFGVPKNVGYHDLTHARVLHDKADLIQVFGRSILLSVRGTE
jgi:hypothetical protein